MFFVSGGCTVDPSALTACDLQSQGTNCGDLSGPFPNLCSQ